MLKRLAGWTAAVVAGLGLIGVVAWFLFSQITGATLVVFRTGSMAPTMPQGALAVSLPVAADQIRVGDVITVPRSVDGLPITHRVIDIRHPDHNGGTSSTHAASRELVLQGDANAVPDARPYAVQDVYRVVAAVPKLGLVLTVLQSPLGVGSLTIFAGALTVWAWWPRGRSRPPRGRHRAVRPSMRDAVHS